MNRIDIYKTVYWSDYWVFCRVTKKELKKQDVQGPVNIKLLLLLVWKKYCQNCYYKNKLAEVHTGGAFLLLTRQQALVQNKYFRITEGYILTVIQYNNIESNYPEMSYREQFFFHFLKSKKGFPSLIFCLLVLCHFQLILFCSARLVLVPYLCYIIILSAIFVIIKVKIQQLQQIIGSISISLL